MVHISKSRMIVQQPNSIQKKWEVWVIGKVEKYMLFRLILGPFSQYVGFINISGLGW